MSQRVAGNYEWQVLDHKYNREGATCHYYSGVYPRDVAFCSVGTTHENRTRVARTMASQVYEAKCHDLEVMGSKPGWVKLGALVLLSKSYLNQKIYTVVEIINHF